MPTTAAPRSPGGRLLAAGAAALVVTLAGCGDPAPPERPQGPVVLRSPEVTAPASTPAPEPTAATPSGGPGATPVAPNVRDPEAEIEADDQSGAGRQVRVSEVELTAAPGHVVVFDARTGEPLGSVAVRPGRTRGVVVPLDRPLTRPAQLVVALRADDGDGRFDAERDGVLVDDDGEPVDEDIRYTL